MDATIKEMVDNGVMHESEAPFDEEGNKFTEHDSEPEITLPHTIELRDPFDFGEDNRVTELVFKNRLEVSMVMSLKIGMEMQYGNFVPIISSMTGVSTAIIKKLGIHDFANCVNLVNYFFYK